LTVVKHCLASGLVQAHAGSGSEVAHQRRLGRDATPPRMWWLLVVVWCGTRVYQTVEPIKLGSMYRTYMTLRAVMEQNTRRFGSSVLHDPACRRAHRCVSNSARSSCTRLHSAAWKPRTQVTTCYSRPARKHSKVKPCPAHMFCFYTEIPETVKTYSFFLFLL
jgi:hypothetical protein